MPEALRILIKLAIVCCLFAGVAALLFGISFIKAFLIMAAIVALIYVCMFIMINV